MTASQNSDDRGASVERGREDAVTPSLEGNNGGSDLSLKDLLPKVYGQLRALAQQRMAMENPGHSLQATALVHEVYLKLFGPRKLPWQGQAHFYAAAADAMRQILLDHAKAKNRKKRGGGAERRPLNFAALATSENSEQILALDDALCRLENEHPEIAEVVRLRFFAGLTVEETGNALELSPRTIDRRWQFGRAWLYREISE